MPATCSKLALAAAEEELILATDTEGASAGGLRAEELAAAGPACQQRRPWRRWQTAGAAVAALGLVGAVLLLPRGNHGQVQVVTEPGHWGLQMLPELAEFEFAAAHIDAAMKLPEPRQLQDVEPYFYDPETLSAIRTQCVIDTEQSAAYILQAIVQLYRGIDGGTGARCPDATQTGCAANLAAIVTSFFWIASYLSLAASSCAETVNSRSLCVADWTCVMANVGEVVTSSIAVSGDCDFPFTVPEDVATLVQHWQDKFTTTGAPNDTSSTEAPTTAAPEPPAPTGNTTKLDEMLALVKIKMAHLKAKSDFLNNARAKVLADMEAKHAAGRARRDFQFNQIQCTSDIMQVIGYLIRSVLQIRSAAQTGNCPDPRVCAVDLMNVVSSFAWISQFTALAVNDCNQDMVFNQNAACAADISDIVAGLTNGCAAAIASIVDCADSPDGSSEVKLQPMARRLFPTDSDWQAPDRSSAHA